MNGLTSEAAMAVMAFDRELEPSMVQHLWLQTVSIITLVIRGRGISLFYEHSSASLWQWSSRTSHWLPFWSIFVNVVFGSHKSMTWWPYWWPCSFLSERHQLKLRLLLTVWTAVHELLGKWILFPCGDFRYLGILYCLNLIPRHCRTEWQRQFSC